MIQADRLWVLMGPCPTYGQNQVQCWKGRGLPRIPEGCSYLSHRRWRSVWEKTPHLPTARAPGLSAEGARTDHFTTDYLLLQQLGSDGLGSSRT